MLLHDLLKLLLSQCVCWPLISSSLTWSVFAVELLRQYYPLTQLLTRAFYVTPITYHNLLVKTSRNGSHPIMLGPVLIHQTKKFQPFHCFASILIRLNPNLVHPKAFGTDGDQNSSKHSIYASPKLSTFDAQITCVKM